jgi:hypothetical protein
MDNSNAGPLLFTLGFKKAYFRNGSIEMNWGELPLPQGTLPESNEEKEMNRNEGPLFRVLVLGML